MSNSSASTPGRATSVRLNPPAILAQEPALAFERSSAEIARLPAVVPPGLWHSSIAGWRLEPLQRRAFTSHEWAGLAGSVLGPSDLQTPVNWHQVPQFRQLTELPGVTYSANAAPSGDLFWCRSIPAGDSLDSGNSRLTADQMAFPSATLASETVPMDRVALSTTAQGPDGEWFLRFACPGGTFSAPDRILNFCFPGPSSPSGTGIWNISFGGDGYAEFAELQNSNQWNITARTPYCPVHSALGVTHTVHVCCYSVPENLSLSGAIAVEFVTSERASSSHPIGGEIQGGNPSVRNFFIPISGGGTGNAGQLRIDCRRDLGVSWQLSRAQYPASAPLIDDRFALPFDPVSSQPITLTWFAKTSATAQVTATLQDGKTGNPIPVSGSNAGFPTYAPPFPSRQLQVAFTFTGDTNSTASLFGLRVQRDAVANSTSPSETLVQQSVTGFRVAADPASGGGISAEVVLSDAAVPLPETASLPGQVVTIDTTCPLSATPISLFRGELRRVTTATVGKNSAGREFGQTTWKLAGPMRRLLDPVCPSRFDFGKDFRSRDARGQPLPFSASDALAVLFAFAGVAEDELLLPEESAGLFAAGGRAGILYEPRTSLGDLILRWSWEYFGAIPYFEPNYSNRGAWILIPIPETNANPVFTFVTANSGGKVPHSVGGYPPATAPVFKRSYQVETLRANANHVVAYGLNHAGSSLAPPELLVQTAFNPDGIAAGNLDSRPGFAPMTEFLPGAATPEALNWFTRRLFDAIAHARTRRRFQSHLVFVADPGSRSGYRPLRPYDCVSVSGVPAMIAQVLPAYRSDDHQFAFYETIDL